MSATPTPIPSHIPSLPPEAALAQALPRLKMAQHRTRRSALHYLYYSGEIDTKWDLATDVIQGRASTPGVLAAMTATQDAEELVVCSEGTVSQRLFQNLLLPVQRSLSGLQFGDALIRPRSPTSTGLPDVVGFVPPGSASLGFKEAVGELKHPFNKAHDYEATRTCTSDEGLRRILGQPVQYMQERRQSWGWWSTYEQTIVFRLCAGGEKPILQVSTMLPYHQVSSTDTVSVREGLAWAYRTNAGLGLSASPVICEPLVTKDRKLLAQHVPDSSHFSHDANQGMGAYSHEPGDISKKRRHS